MISINTIPWHFLNGVPAIYSFDDLGIGACVLYVLHDMSCINFPSR